MTVSRVALEAAGRNTEKWLIVADAKWKQSRTVVSIRYERRGLSCGTLLLRSWVKGQFSVWRWDRDEGCPSSITDDSQSALTFNTWTCLSAALSLSAHCRLLQSLAARRDRVHNVRGKKKQKNTKHVHMCCQVQGERMHTFIRAHVRLIRGCTFIMHVCRCKMSKVHCGTLLTSNVTNNFFLQLHCSNPFSGLWNGNIITFLWCSAFDKTAARWAECLTELDASPKPSPLSTLLLSRTHSSPSLLSLSLSYSLSRFSPFFSPLLFSHPRSLPLSSPKAHSASLSLARPGIAVDKRGVVYFVDGTTIQKINERGLLSTVIGSNGLMSTQPLSCDARMDISQVS